MYNRSSLNFQLSQCIYGTFLGGGGGGWLGQNNNKDHLSPAEAGRWAKLGNNGDIEYFNKTAKLLIPKEPFTLRFY